MKANDLLGRMARVFPLPMVNRTRSQRNRRRPSRIGFMSNLEQLEDRTLLASVSITQLTDFVDAVSEAPSISGDGSKVAFSSNGDLTGQNADGNYEIFLFDAITSSFMQVTDSKDGLSSFVGSVNRDGTRIAFNSNSDLFENGENGNSEIFYFDTTTRSITQVTRSTIDDSAGGSISDDGTRIAFWSHADLTGGNADGNLEIFWFDITTGSMTQVTDTTSETSSSPTFNRFPSLNDDGTRIAFESNADLIGQSAGKNIEIFLFDTTASSFTPVTDGGGEGASISGDGSTIAFSSSANLTGDNAKGNFELFVFDTTTGSLDQITDFSAVERPPEIVGATINSDGTKIAFMSDAGDAPGVYEIFLFDTITNALTQVTDESTPGGVRYSPSISNDGAKIAFMSQFD